MKIINDPSKFIDKIVCPYCKHEYQYEDEYDVEYTGNDNIGYSNIFVNCPSCDEEFELEILITIKYHSTPIVENDEWYD